MAATLGTLTAATTYTQKCRMSNAMRNFTVQVTGALSAGTVIPQFTLKANPDEATDLDWINLAPIAASPGHITDNDAGYWIRAKADGAFAGAALVLYQETASGSVGE